MEDLERLIKELRELQKDLNAGELPGHRSRRKAKEVPHLARNIENYLRQRTEALKKELKIEDE